MTTVEDFEGVDARLVGQAHFTRAPDDRIREGEHELRQVETGAALAKRRLEELKSRA